MCGCLRLCFETTCGERVRCVMWRDMFNDELDYRTIVCGVQCQQLSNLSHGFSFYVRVTEVVLSCQNVSQRPEFWQVCEMPLETEWLLVKV